LKMLPSSPMSLHLGFIYVTDLSKSATSLQMLQKRFSGFFGPF